MRAARGGVTVMPSRGGALGASLMVTRANGCDARRLSSCRKDQSGKKPCREDKSTSRHEVKTARARGFAGKRKNERRDPMKTRRARSNAPIVSRFSRFVERIIGA
jgi:hypothetical protein